MEIVLVGNKVESKDELTKVLKQPMETFFAEKEFAIEVEVPDIMEGIEVKIDTSWMGGTTETYLKDNKKIKSIEYADTFSCCKEYNEKGKVIREIKITGGSDYSCKEFDDKGILTKSIWRDDESGSYIEDYYNENRLEISIYPDGRYYEWHYHENGEIQKSISVEADGTRTENNYY